MAGRQVAPRGRLDGSGHGHRGDWALEPALSAPGCHSHCRRVTNGARIAGRSTDPPRDPYVGTV